MRILGVLIVLAGCGRIGFEPTHDAAGGGDAGPQVADHPCNVPIDLGPLVPAIGTQSVQSWIAVAAAGTRLLIAESTANGLAIAPIDLATAPPVLGSVAMVSPVVGDNLQIVASGDRLLTTSSRAGGTEIEITDGALVQLVMRNEAGLAIAAPDASAPDGAGGFLLASSGMNVVRIDRLDANGAIGAGNGWALPNVRGTSMTRLEGTGYVEASDLQGGGRCSIRPIDPSLALITEVGASPCMNIRVAALADGSRFAVSYSDGARIVGVTTPADLSDPTAPVMLLSAQFTPARMSADAAGFWTVAAVAAASLHARFQRADGQVGIELALVPYAATSTVFAYDVVNVGGRAYAVWLDTVTSPSLYIERLCAQ